MDKNIIIRVRGIIINEDKLFLVNIVENDFYCLPGGKLEYGEDLKECLERELIEELGVKPEIGNLMYINTFIGKDLDQSIDFIFEVKNGKDYVDCNKLERTHAHELSDLCWVGKDDDVTILPKTVARYFKEGRIITGEVVYIRD